MITGRRLADGKNVIFTPSRVSAVGDGGSHMILEIQDQDGKPMLAKDVSKALKAEAMIAGDTMAEKLCADQGYDGYRSESNHGRLLTRENFHVHYILVLPGTNVRRSVDDMRVTV